MASKVEVEAIAIQRFRYAETSQIVHLLSPELGRVVVLARGSFRPKNSYQGPIDLLVRARWSISLVEGRELGVLLGRKVESAYPRLRRSLQRYGAARHMLHLLRETTPVGQGDPELYRLFDRGLRAAEELPEERLALLLLSFDLHLLRLVGLEPQLDACLRCGKEGRASYVEAEGGAVCNSCRRPGEGSSLSPAVALLLRDLAGRRLAEVADARPDVVRRAEALLQSHLGYHLEAAPPPRLPRRPARARLADPQRSP